MPAVGRPRVHFAPVNTQFFSKLGYEERAPCLIALECRLEKVGLVLGISTLLLLFRKLVIVYPILHYVSFKAQILSHLINEKLAPVRISLKLSPEKVSLAQSEFASDPSRSLLCRCE